MTRPRFKSCIRCKAKKAISEFYRHAMMADGRLNKCIDCAKADVRANRAARADYYRAYDTARKTRPERVALKKKMQARWRKSNPLKYAAHIAVNNAVRAGRLQKQLCEFCGSHAAHAHHDDYNKPLDVRWLCAKHHTAVHRGVA